MTSIGETLRRERVRQGLDLQQVSHTTKIGTRLLQAMEADDFGKLPGGVFTRSFIKQYATTLGISSAYIEAELRNLNMEGEATELPQPSEVTFSGLPDSGPESNSFVASAVWVILAVMVCGGVYYIMNRPATTSVAAPVVTEQKPPETKPVEAAPAPAPTPPPAEQSVASLTAPAGSGPVQVVLTASEQAWVSVSADGKVTFAGLMQPNERRAINANEKVKIVAGNAGGLEISLNGKAIEPLGPHGQVRTVLLTEAGAYVVPRTPPSPAPLL